MGELLAVVVRPVALLVEVLAEKAPNLTFGNNTASAMHPACITLPGVALLALPTRS